MKYSSFLISVCILWSITLTPGVGQTPVEVLQRIISRAQETSVYQDQVNWDSLTHHMIMMSGDATSIPDLAPALRHMLEKLGDEHGRVFYQGNVLAYYYSGELKPHQQSFDPKWYGIIQGGTAYPFLVTKLEDSTGYVRMPGMPMGDNLQMAKNIQDAVCAVVDQGVTQWIVDLRFNGGGNINPMAEGLATILGDGLLGGAKSYFTSQDVVWEMRNGDFYNDGYTIQLEESCPYTLYPRVAVLTSLYTASSGEALAVMFKSRPNSRFFGEKTLGMVTGTNWDTFGDEVVLSISTNHYCDRKGQVYYTFIDVDEFIPFIPSDDLLQDAAVQRALRWLNGN